MTLSIVFFVQCSGYGKFWETKNATTTNNKTKIIATHLYSLESGAIRAYAIDQNSGSLSLAAGPFSTGTVNDVVIDPRTQIAYVAGPSPNGLRLYSVSDPNTFSNLGNYLPSNTATRITLLPSGNFMYASDNTNIYGFSADASNNLTPLSGFPLAAGCMGGVAMLADPFSQWLYRYNYSASHTIKTDKINPDGTLTLAVQSLSTFSAPVATRVLSTGEGYYDAFIATSTTDNVHYYPVNQSTGALAAGAGFPLSAGCVSASDAVLHPNEKYLYAADIGDKAIYTYSVDPSTRSLTQMGTPLGTPNGPTKMAITPDGTYLYLGGNNAAGVGLIRTYKIENDGSLVSMPDFSLSNPTVSSFTLRTTSVPAN